MLRAQLLFLAVQYRTAVAKRESKDQVQWTEVLEKIFTAVQAALGSAKPFPDLPTS